MAHDVFISYASKDKPAADALCATMEANGVRCWIAPRDIQYGSDWGEAIVDAIGASRAMVLVFSSNANGSPHIKREVDRAVSKGVTIIPIRIEDVAPARALEYYISPVHWLDAVTPPMERHFAALADKVRMLLATEERERLQPSAPAAVAPTPAPAPPLPAPAPVPVRRRSALLPALGGGAVAAVAAALLWLQPWNPRTDPAREARQTQQIADEAARKAMEGARAAQLVEEQRRAEAARQAEEQRRAAARVDEQRRAQEAQRQAQLGEQQRRQDEARRAEDARQTEEARRAADEAQRRAATLQQQLQQLQQQKASEFPKGAQARVDPFVVKAHVEQQLRGRGLLKQSDAAWGVRVDVAPTGAVTLTGIVQSGDQRAESIRIAREVPGVTEVRPHINVRDSWGR